MHACGCVTRECCAGLQLAEEGNDGCREVLKLLTEEQLDRYEAFRRSSLSKANMRRVGMGLLHAQSSLGFPRVLVLGKEGFAGALQLLHSITAQAPNPNTTIVMCGITKIFVGDLIETGEEEPPETLGLSLFVIRTAQLQHAHAARMLAAEAGDKGALRPVHVHKAYQQLDREGKVPHTAKKVPRLRL